MFLLSMIIYKKSGLYNDTLEGFLLPLMYLRTPI